MFYGEIHVVIRAGTIPIIELIPSTTTPCTVRPLGEPIAKFATTTPGKSSDSRASDLTGKRAATSLR